MVQPARRDRSATAYVCPDCKTPLVDLKCAHCAHQFGLASGFPALVSNDPRYRAARLVMDAYDAIYARHSNFWEDQGRSRELIGYFARLVKRFPARRVLEVGCGEGVLLTALEGAGERYGTDLSIRALERAHARVSAGLCVALGERLPYSDGFFDVAASVCVMERFLDDEAASAEICRVLREGGRYLALVHLHLTPRERIAQMLAEYVLPRPRPMRLARRLFEHFYRPVHHPVENAYRIEDAKACLEHSGFTVSEIIHNRNTPDAPLHGPHAVIYVCQKPALAAISPGAPPPRRPW